MTCRFCGDKGCIACFGERKRLEKEAMKPLFVAKTPEDLQLLSEAVGRRAIEKAYTPNAFGVVGGERELEFNLAMASFRQHLRQYRTTDAEEATNDSV